MFKPQCKIYLIPEKAVVLTVTESWCLPASELLQCLNYVKLKYKIHDGDLVVLEELTGYRNNGTLIYDAVNDCLCDGDCNVPENMRILEKRDSGVIFPISQWSVGEDSYIGTYTVYFNHIPYRDEFIKNIRQDNMLFSRQITYTYAIVLDRYVYIVIATEAEEKIAKKEYLLEVLNRDKLEFKTWVDDEIYELINSDVKSILYFF